MFVRLKATVAVSVRAVVMKLPSSADISIVNPESDCPESGNLGKLRLIGCATFNDVILQI
jgi:hypothetical protein